MWLASEIDRLSSSQRRVMIAKNLKINLKVIERCSVYKISQEIQFSTIANNKEQQPNPHLATITPSSTSSSGTFFPQ